MSTSFPEIPVTAPAIIRQVGSGAYTRGQRYMREGNVIRYTYDEQARVLEGQVAGSGSAPYTARVAFPAEVTAGSYAFSATCSCPVAHNCKHAVALMLTAIDRTAKAKRAMTASSSTWKTTASTDEKVQEILEMADTVGLQRAADLLREHRGEQASAGTEEQADAGTRAGQSLPAWRRSLAHSLAARPSYDSRNHRVTGALDVRLVVPGKYGWTKNIGAPRVSLEARPLMMGARGKWIKGGLSWEKFSGSAAGSAGTGLLPEHAAWFNEFYAVIRGSQSIYSSHRDWASISNVDSSLLWQMLESASEVGLSVLLDGKETGLAIASAPQVELALEPVPERGSSADALRLTPLLRWGAYTLPASFTHKLGSNRQGFIALGGAAQVAYVKAATAARWDSTLPSALAQAEDLAPADRPSWLAADSELVLIPLAEPLDAVAESLISGEPVTVPAADVPAFFAS